MTHLRKMITAAALIPAGIAAIALSGAGAASAVTPIADNGRIGVQLNQGETALFGQLNAGAAIESIINSTQIGVRLAPGSRFESGPNVVWGRLDQFANEAASRGGEISLGVLNPARGSQQFFFIQNW
ncbi:hypothetical protein [Rhodococcus qingshengii]|uniref:hypothetical protein n=1 Tax=Rhodococcus qingshengii TaxID=334542 RepID=UPI001C8B9790|nr:hypothetical protein [Rhodococcus qingshengii]MBX9150732.1 hypothetical protein [Rhodococcus qingshengii]